jgi:hypothetical protein
MPYEKGLAGFFWRRVEDSGIVAGSFEDKKMGSVFMSDPIFYLVKNLTDFTV